MQSFRKPKGRDQTSPRRGRRTSFVLALAFVSLSGACDTLTGNREPEVAHIWIRSTDVSEVTLIISQWFIHQPNPECPTACEATIQLVQSDTSKVSLPFEGSYPFNFRLQFFAETFPVEPEVATLSLRVDLDDKEWYNGSRALQPENDDGEPETLRFVYQYTRATLPN